MISIVEVSESVKRFDGAINAGLELLKAKAVFSRSVIDGDGVHQVSVVGNCYECSCGEESGQLCSHVAAIHMAGLMGQELSEMTVWDLAMSLVESGHLDLWPNESKAIDVRTSVYRNRYNSLFLVCSDQDKTIMSGSIATQKTKDAIYKWNIARDARETYDTWTAKVQQ